MCYEDDELEVVYEEKINEMTRTESTGDGFKNSTHMATTQFQDAVLSNLLLKSSHNSHKSSYLYFHPIDNRKTLSHMQQRMFHEAVMMAR